MAEKTAKQIVADANELARRFYSIMGYVAPEGFRFDRARHTREKRCWDMAVEAMEFLTATEVHDALLELG